MQSPLPQLTTILLLVHLGLGCCLHHSHACDLGSCELETTPVDGCENHVHSAVAAAARQECDEPPVGIAHEGHHSHECSGENCTFLADRTRLVSKLEEASHFSSLLVQTLGHAATVSPDALFANGTAPGLARTALPRTHLTLQVLQL